jgi:hypothetical protein
MTTKRSFTCCFCSVILQAWLRVAGKPQIKFVRTPAGLGLALQQAVVPMAQAEVSPSAGD